MLKIQADRLRSELTQIHELITEITQRANAGIPGDDLPANDISQEVFQVQLVGELMLASQRLQALAEVIGD